MNRGIRDQRHFVNLTGTRRKAADVTNPPTIRIIIADDQHLIRDGMEALLSLQPGIEVVGMAENGVEALRLAESLRPDVVLMDVQMPQMNGVEATRRIRAALPDVRVLVLTTFTDDTYVLEALRVGASGYVLKDVRPAELAQKIRNVAAGKVELDPSVAGAVVNAMSHTAAPPAPRPPSAAPADDLTPRERDVLRLLATGASNREIAEQLVISEGTVKNHISNILSRLGLRDRTQAAIYAKEQGYI